MNISVDGGAVCLTKGQGFGNYIFSASLLQALQKYDNQNNYYIYTFCSMPSWFKETKRFTYQRLRPRTLWLSTRVSIEERKSQKDIFLAFNQAIPLFTSSQIIAFSHGLSFHFFPHLYTDTYYALKDQLAPMVKRAKCILVSSRRVKQEMQALYPNYTNFITLNYGVPFDMMESEKIPKKKFFLFVGMDHPIKNIDFIIKAFQSFRKSGAFKDYKLYLVGNHGHYDDRKNNVIAVESISRQELRELYREATAYLTASFYESYNIPVIEAISQDCPVVGLRSAIIPEFKPYVFHAAGEEDFIQYMKEVASGARRNININYIKKVFSWEKYIQKLQSLYVTPEIKK